MVAVARQRPRASMVASARQRPWASMVASIGLSSLFHMRSFRLALGLATQPHQVALYGWFVTSSFSSFSPHLTISRIE
jgi:hypothetical protein